MLRKDAQGLPQRSEGICTKGIMSLKRPCLACKMSKPLMSEGLGELKWDCPLCSRACLKIAFCKIPSQFASDFMLDLGGVVGYIDEIQHRIRCKVGRKIVGMNFQTRSRAPSSGKIPPVGIFLLQIPLWKPASWSGYPAFSPPALSCTYALLPPSLLLPWAAGTP